MDKTKPLLAAGNIHKTFYNPVEKKVLRGVNLEVYEGESVAIMGRSGEGKSTLLHILGTLESASNGELKICGESVSFFNRSRMRNQYVAFVFQSFHLLEDSTVLENVLMPAKIAREATKIGSLAYNRSIELLEQVQLADKANTPAKLLSGGEKQRTAIARALCNDPALILADEPSGNLDAQTAAIVHNLLLNFSKRPGKALVVVTHHEELALLCNRRLSLHNGQIDLTKST